MSFTVSFLNRAYAFKGHDTIFENIPFFGSFVAFENLPLNGLVLNLNSILDACMATLTLNFTLFKSKYFTGQVVSLGN